MQKVQKSNTLTATTASLLPTATLWKSNRTSETPKTWLHIWRPHPSHMIASCAPLMLSPAPEYPTLWRSDVYLSRLYREAPDLPPPSFQWEVAEAFLYCILERNILEFSLSANQDSYGKES